MADIKMVANGENHSLLLLDFFHSEKTFSDLDHEGHGYDWQTVVSFIIGNEYPELADKVNYDSEGSMFVAYGDDENALLKIKDILDDLSGDQEKLKNVIVEIPEELWV